MTFDEIAGAARPDRPINLLPSVQSKVWILLLCIVVVATGVRIYSAQTVGWGWDSIRSFSMVNFDEASSCAQHISGFGLERHVGWVTVNAATLMGNAPPQSLWNYPPGWGDEDSLLTLLARKQNMLHSARIRDYCHSAEHLLVARTYSAVLGGLTILVLGIMALLLVPEDTRIALTAAALLAVSGFHASQSHMATLDAPSVFFVYAMMTWAIFCLRTGSRTQWLVLPVLLYLAITAKEWPFALLSLLPFLPARVWTYLFHGFTIARFISALGASLAFLGLISNADESLFVFSLLALLLYCGAVPWLKIYRPMLVLWLFLPILFLVLFHSGYLDEIMARYLTGPLLFRDHGAGLAVIGWHKIPRNLLNLPLSLIMGIGFLAFCCLFPGIRSVLDRRKDRRVWLVLLSVVAFAAFLAVLMTATYYRHYLMLIPLAALVAAMGFWRLDLSRYKLAVAIFIGWPALLGLDMVSDYHRDPRIELRSWYREVKPQRVLMSFYVSPPTNVMTAHKLFTPEYAQGNAATLRQAQYLVLNEIWYGKAFRNELNGPIINDLTKLPLTKPEYAQFYREALAGEHRYLKLVRAFRVNNFMPELVVHKWLYGTFQLKVGDILIFKIGPVR